VPTRLVTLTTDIGWAYAAQMKGVLARTLSPGTIVDLAHDLPPHAVEEAAFLLRHMAATFPRGTVHVAIIDPGVGGPRAAVAVECRDGSLLVGPDNGVLAPLAAHFGVRRVVRLTRREAGDREGATFDGRDLFAPAAARLASGTPLRALGPPATLAPLDVPVPMVTPDELRGRIVHVDRFGNLITDLPAEMGPREGAKVPVRLGRRRPMMLRRVRSYVGTAVGETALIGSSFGLLEVSVREGNASDRYRARTGLAVTIGRRARRNP
jgi:S-adenosyl-L-methionine hydrolase (adenosine-forming)